VESILHEASGIFHDFWRFRSPRCDAKRTWARRVTLAYSTIHDTKEKTVALFSGRIPNVPDTGSVSYFYELRLLVSSAARICRSYMNAIHRSCHAMEIKRSGKCKRRALTSNVSILNLSKDHHTRKPHWRYGMNMN